MDGWMEGASGWKDGEGWWIDGRMVNGWMYGWVDACMQGWMGG